MTPIQLRDALMRALMRAREPNIGGAVLTIAEIEAALDVVHAAMGVPVEEEPTCSNPSHNAACCIGEADMALGEP